MKRAAQHGTIYDTLRNIENVKKTCTKCGEEKFIDAFGNRKESPDGHETQCLECHKKRQAVYRAERRPNYF